MKRIAFKRWGQGLTITFAIVVLAACGGGGGSSSPTVAPVSTSDVPVAATQQSSAAMAFVKSVVDKGEANQDTPLVVGEAMLASSDSDEPAGGL